MIYILTAWYPGNKAKEIMEVFKKVSKIPDYIKKWQIFFTADGLNGTKTYNLIYIEDKASDEANIFIAKVQQLYVDNIEGYRWRIEPVLGLKDSIKIFS